MVVNEDSRKVHKCVVLFNERTNEKTGTIVLPNSFCEDVKVPCKFVATKKYDTDFVRFLAVDSEAKVFGVYAKVVYGTLNMFIPYLTGLAKKFGVDFYPETFGTCPGDARERNPCVFDGVIIVKKGKEAKEKIGDIELNLKELKKDSKSVVIELTIKDIEQ